MRVVDGHKCHIAVFLRCESYYFDLPGPGWSENVGNRRPEWLLYDLGQSVSINALRFVKMAEGSCK